MASHSKQNTQAGISLQALQLHKLPSLPHVLLRLLETCYDDNTSLRDIARIINQDAAIAARVISLARAASYYQSRQPVSLENSLIILGLETVKSTVITASIQQFFSHLNKHQTQFLKAFWRRSLSTALMAKSLATLTSYNRTDEAYLAGLIHNIGQLWFSSLSPEEYNQCLQQAGDDTTLLEHERRLFGYDHCEVGATVVRQWHLQGFSADALAYHHHALADIIDSHHLVKLVHLANCLSTTHDAPADEALAEADTLFGLTATLTSEIHQRIQQEVAELAVSMEIDIGDSEATEASDRNKQIQLAEEVRNIGLLSAARQQLFGVASSTAILRHARIAARLLFDMADLRLFSFHRDEQTLRMPLAEQETEATASHQFLEIPLEPQRSLVSDALLLGKATHSLQREAALKVVDRQLIDLCRAQAIMCLPLRLQGEPLGVLVLGVNEPQMIMLEKQRKLMRLFAREVADALLQSRPPDLDAAAPDSIQQGIREVIHEANNPLTIIRNYLDSLGHQWADDEQTSATLQTIKDEIDRTGNILLRLTDVFNPAAAEVKALDVNRLIEELGQLFQQSLLLTHGMRLETQLDAAIPPLASHPAAIRQILINLMKNAVEAMSAGGTLGISSHDRVNFNGRAYVEVCVSDTGAGVPGDMLRNLFQPVLSSKGGQHAGLGLSIVKKLVDRLGGLISCRSSQQGTEFHLLIPRQVGAAHHDHDDLNKDAPNNNDPTHTRSE